MDENAFGGSGKRHSAYLLIYEQRKYTVVQNAAAPVVPTSTNNSLLQKYPNIPSNMVQNLLEENVQIALDGAFLCEVYSNWFLQLCRSEKFKDDLNVMQSVSQVDYLQPTVWMMFLILAMYR